VSTPARTPLRHGLRSKALLSRLVRRANCAAASASLDLTAANIVSVQALQSGTAGTIQVQSLLVEALN
jgi:hypothetical protein